MNKHNRNGIGIWDDGETDEIGTDGIEIDGKHME